MKSKSNELKTVERLIREAVTRIKLSKLALKMSNASSDQKHLERKIFLDKNLIQIIENHLI